MKMKNKTLSITIPDIHQLATDGEKLIFKKEAEESLVKLLELKQKVDEAIEKVKEAIKQAGEQILPNFKGVEGEVIKCIYRYYGAKYEIEDEEKAKPFIIEKVVKTLDYKAIDEIVKQTGDLPEGIKTKEREKQLSIIVKKNE